MNSSSRLASALERFSATNECGQTSIPGLTLYRSCDIITRQPTVLYPAICVVAQGHKNIYFGDYTRSYNADNYLINSVTMPVEIDITEASPERPYLGLSLAIDSYLVSQLLIDMGKYGGNPRTQINDIILSTTINHHLENSFVRLLECLDSDMDQEILAPALKREIFYEVLKGPHGNLLRNCVSNHAGANRIAPVVHYIEENFQQSLDVDTIARYAGMSSSSLHDHFKQATSMTPMQFVKSLRLHRAHSLLLSGNPVSESSYQVGYNSPSQFSREFKRFFGDAPSDIQQLQATG